MAGNVPILMQTLYTVSTPCCFILCNYHCAWSYKMCCWVAGDLSSPVVLLQMPTYIPGKPWTVYFVVFGGSGPYRDYYSNLDSDNGWVKPCW
jgi:hypothetical protein